MSRRPGNLPAIRAAVLAFALGGLLAVGLPLLGIGEGSDDQAVQLAESLAPGYRPWFEPAFEPGEWTERLLFGLQAGLGAGLLGWIMARTSRTSPTGPTGRSGAGRRQDGSSAR
jgi:cobalt/nickel transport protein